MSDPNTATYPFPPKPMPLSIDEKACYRGKIKRLLKERNMVMVVRYYTNPKIQQLAEKTSGYISDSLEMARFSAKHPTSTLLIVGAKFMGETTKILSPEKTILMPTFQTERSPDLGCPVEELNVFYGAHSDRTVVVYVNTSAAVKTRADWVVASNIAVELIDHLNSLGEKIIWVSDKHLGRHVQRQTGGDILCWQGACAVHDEFKTQALTRLQEEYPGAAILVHPKSPQAIVDTTDAVGSTSRLIATAKTLPHQQLIMATGWGIFYKMQQVVPDKELLEIPAVGEGATRHSCAHCPWMAINGLQSTMKALEQEGSSHEVHTDERLRKGALVPLNRMLGPAATLRG